MWIEIKLQDDAVQGGRVTSLECDPFIGLTIVEHQLVALSKRPSHPAVARPRAKVCLRKSAREVVLQLLGGPSSKSEVLYGTGQPRTAALD